MLELLTYEHNLRFAQSAFREARQRISFAREARRAVARVVSPEHSAHLDFRRAYALVTHLVESEPLHKALGVPASQLEALLEISANVGTGRQECDALGLASTSVLGLSIEAFERLQQIARDSELLMLLELEWKVPEVMRQLEDPELVRRVRAGAGMSPDEARYYQQVINDLPCAEPGVELHQQVRLCEQLAPVLIGTSVHAEVQAGSPFVWAGMSDPMLDRIRSELEPEYRALEHAASVDGRAPGADRAEQARQRSATTELDAVARRMWPLTYANTRATAIGRLEAYFQGGGTTTSYRSLAFQLNCSFSSIRAAIEHSEQVRTLREVAKACDVFHQHGVRVGEGDRQHMIKAWRSEPERVAWAVKLRDPSEMKQFLHELRASNQQAR